MNATGHDLVHNNKIYWEDAYNYSTKNWCIPNSEDSLFASGYINGQCNLPYDPYLENKVKGASPELQEICEGNPECLVEGSAGEINDSTDSMVVVRDLQEKEVYPVEDPLTWKEPDPEEEDKIIEKTTAEGAHDPYESPPQGASAHGDPHFKV